MTMKAFLWSLSLSATDAFISPGRTSPPLASKRYGIAEWRDLDYDGPPLDPGTLLDGTASTSLPKAIAVLPFPFDEVLLQGQTKQLRLYEDRFLQLFDDAVDHGVVGMGLCMGSGMLRTIPLCEMEAYNRMDGFGVFVTIRVVGRAQLMNVTQQDPYIKGVCVELVDQLPPDLEICNVLAGTIEQAIVAISSMEHRLKYALPAGENKDDTDDDMDMKRRIDIARLEDKFYEEDEEAAVDEADDDEDDIELDRRGRFQQAYEVAMDTDSQGYLSAATTDERSPKELTALSWAAFCTEEDPDGGNAAFRVQAMGETNLLERLKLASQVLKLRRGQLETEMKKAGLSKKDDEEL